jgi:hypothetical protein
MLIGAGLFVAAPRWVSSDGWKYYLVYAVAGGIFLNGLRVILQASLRRGQKMATYDHGFALWRNRSLTIFRWEQIDEIEVSPEFFGFTIWCRNEEGRRQKIHFDSASDPTDQLRVLWRDLEERCWRHRLPVISDSIAKGEEAVFVRKTWGKETGTKIFLSQYGLAATPRYKSRRFLDWLEVADLRLEGEHMVVRREGEGEPWLSEPIMAVPGCVAIVEAGEEARRHYLEIVKQLETDRVLVARTALAAGQSITVGTLILSPDGLVDEDTHVPWSEIRSARLDGASLEIMQGTDEVFFDVEALSFVDRVFLRVMAGACGRSHG